MTLYDLTEEMRQLLDKLDELEQMDEKDETYEQAVLDTFGMVLMDFEDKADDYYKVLRQLQAEMEALKSEKMRIAKKQAAKEKNIDRLRNAMLRAMQMTGQRKLKTALTTMSITTRTKPVLNKPVEEIPEAFWKIKAPEADMKAVENWMKRLDEIGGSEEYASWVHWEQVDGLTIR